VLKESVHHKTKRLSAKRRRQPFNAKTVKATPAPLLGLLFKTLADVILTSAPRGKFIGSRGFGH
jgi:hypothetical protein